MRPVGSFRKFLERPPGTLFEEVKEDPHARPKGPLFSRRVFWALLIVFGISLMLAMDWFGLLLLNAPGVFQQMGTLNTLRVTAVLMGGIAVPSALLMLHYGRLYTYTSEENVFFSITFSLSFLLGSPCALVGAFG
ncbi:hypothetical protein GBA65_00405 [Rubrobacter marinus]|uniref:Uncharacterized protein n=1 Tax=Rubrobacter marinus TaxID=2653852 RepID=A0A6G8PSQ2_9ACTN|nr:hypothetical protein [Rubrobacter marinus]QIN77227.1 hypothetical protein GBA65_00405 [Rubrobacter marinus]